MSCSWCYSSSTKDTTDSLVWLFGLQSFENKQQQPLYMATFTRVDLFANLLIEHLQPRLQ